MTDLIASVDHIRWCADEFTRTGEGVAVLPGGAGAPGGTEAAVSALAPVFGVFGGGFLQAFSAAHAAHLRGTAGLAEVLGRAGATAGAIAGAYERHEAGQAARLHDEGGAL